MPNRFNDRENGEGSYFPRGYTDRQRERFGREDQNFGSSSQHNSNQREDRVRKSRQGRFESSGREYGPSPEHVSRNQEPEEYYGGYYGQEYEPGVYGYESRSDKRWHYNQQQRGFNRNYENREYPQQRFSGSAEQGWYRDRDFGAGTRHSQYEQGPYFGRGPKGYRRSDERIEEDINERLTQHPFVDATEIVVTVQNGEVQLSGSVEDRNAKRIAEDIAESVSGVKDVHNQIRVSRNNNQIR
jgi:hypothetical protein